MALVWHVNHSKKIQTLQIGNWIFTPREIDIIACYISGRSSKHIAALLSLSPNTVEVHTRNIFQKMHINTREEIINQVENSSFYAQLKDHYFYLNLRFDYKKHLLLLGSLCRGKKISLAGDGPLISMMKKDCQILGVLIDESNQEPLIDVQNISEEETMIKLGGSVYAEVNAPYEIAFLSILMALDPNLSSIINPFLEKHEKIDLYKKKLPLFLPMKKKYFYHIVLAFLLIFAAIVVLMYWHFSYSKDLISNLYLLPKDKIFIRENDLIMVDQLFDNRRESSQNPVVAIVGIGGSGKTTLSRFYGKSYGKNLVWELNAQSKEFLEQSLESLASRIGDLSDKNQKEYAHISKGFNGKERFLKLLHFIQKYLKKNPGWLLIYEDLKLDYGDIAEYLMLDPDICGEGKILITTRNANIRFAIHHQQVFEISPLTSEEKEKFFYKIIEGYGNLPKGQVKLFLDKLPPFPFDISVAAHHLGHGACSMDHYINQLSFKEIGTYGDTRHHILLSTVNEIINRHKDFKELLFLLAVIDHVDIPLEFLEDHYGPESIREFVHTLKKHSLVTRMDYKNDVHMFSIHESIQKNLLKYLQSVLDAKAQKACTDKIFDNFRMSLRRKDDLKNGCSLHCIKALLRHCNTAANHLNLLTSKQLGEMRLLTT